jgi:ABC-2 type transport system ATP-binding protein
MAKISVRGLTKHFGAVRAVEGLTFEVPSGQVTGFLGPNGAGKTTTLRMMLGLIRPTAGKALIGGRRYEELAQPRRVVGAVLEATGFHPGRRARDHLRILAEATGVPAGRVDEVLEQVDLTGDADRRVGGYSLGMRQRLGLAAALLGDPEVLVLDEPANGLDPAGMAWLRDLLRDLAGQGRTVVVSSHVLSEVAQTVEHVVIVNGGRLRFAGPLRELGAPGVSVRTAESERLRAVLRERGYEAEAADVSTLLVRDVTAEDVGRLAAEAGIALTGLGEGGTSLEAAFLRLTTTTDTPASPEGAPVSPDTPASAPTR